MSAPEWIKFLTAYAFYENIDLKNEKDLNTLIFDKNKGMFFQGLKWRIQDPSDSAGFGIGMVTLSDAGILNTRNPERSIINVSKTIKKDSDLAYSQFIRIFNPRVISKSSPKEIKKLLKATSTLNESKRNDAIISITIGLIREALKTKSVSDQNDFAGSIYDFIQILNRLRIEPQFLESKDIVTVLCKKKPGYLPPHLLPQDVAVLIHEFVRNSDTGGLPIALSFLTSDILGATNVRSPEHILAEAYRRLPSEAYIDRYLRKMYKRIKATFSSEGFSLTLSEDDFITICSYDEIRKEAVWWEYNITLGRLEEAMRDFVSPYREKVPWSGAFGQQFFRLANNPEWLKETSSILHNIVNLSKNVSTDNFYPEVIQEFQKLTWFYDIQQLVNTQMPLDSLFKRLWELADKMSKLDSNPVASYDSKTGTIMLHRDPREADPYIQRSIVFTWLRKFSIISEESR